jgi:hypothetical protein
MGFGVDGRLTELQFQITYILTELRNIMAGAISGLGVAAVQEN